ncbi:MAG: type VI secretion system baseplate subunit TssE [Gammaproteobacteria bacterium]
MAELTPQERLQPALLDRLTDNDPDNSRESRDQRVLSIKRLKDCVLRDLGWLLNTTNLGLAEQLRDYPQVATSVVNFGIPDLAGSTSSSVREASISDRLKQAIVTFEPRLLKDTVSVEVNLSGDIMSPNTLTVQIEGQLWAQPLPLHLFLKTAVDLETGDFKITEEKST